MSEDMTTKDGFFRAVRLVMRLREGGLLWLAPVCSSWVGLNISRTKRSSANQFRGNPSYAPVALGNIMALACAILMEVAHRRGVQVVIENPPSSTLFRFPALEQALGRLTAFVCTTCRCAFDKSKDGTRLWKQYKLVASAGWIRQLARQCPCKSQKHQALTVTWTNSAGKRCFKGVKNLLQKSAEYPPAFGTQVVAKWQSQPESTPPSTPSSASRKPSRQKRKLAWTEPALEPQSTRALSIRAPAKASRPSANTSWCQPALDR